MNRIDLASLIYQNLSKNVDTLKKQFQGSKDQIGFFFIDDLLPIEIAKDIYSHFPPEQEMVHKNSLRESKLIAAQMNKYSPILEEIIYAFQDRRIVELVQQICGIETLIPDERLYAGGISAMRKADFLNPHLDNSHDMTRQMWRVLNLLYYVTPDWAVENGGNLEIWPNGPKEKQITFESRFNRLVVMATHDKSWHSVSPVKVDRIRCCVSNYYFSPKALRTTDNFHVTTFRGRPEQPLRNLVLKCDGLLRGSIRKLFPNGVKKVTHFYKK